MRWITRIGSAVVLGCASVGPAYAQDSAQTETSRWIFPGSEAENYLRYLQTLGLVPEYPWSARAFSSIELRRLRPRSDDHPWANARLLRARPVLVKGVRVDIAPAEVQTWYNTAFPFGMNDGAVWVGRGLTTAVSAGASARWGPVELTLAPTAFWAENRSFPLMQTGTTSEYVDPLNPITVDRPQRFGDRPYARLDPGQSSLRLDLRGVALGLSTANQWWGPMSEFPYILGNNAPGFAHVFIGSSHPLNIFVGRVHARVVYASLEQSDFSPVPADSGRRFASGAIATFQPRGFPGLEVGATRFFHIAWPDSGLTSEYFTHLFESFLKHRISKVFLRDPLDFGSSSDNQLASIFARWALPKSGFELYGEYGREDHSANPDDLLLEPDHSAAYGIGVRKAWGAGSSLTAVRAEMINHQVSSIARHRFGEGAYYHTFTRQGHTSGGQLLGAGITAGSGAGFTVAFERYSARGFSRVKWSRLVVRDPNSTGRTDVQQVLQLRRGIRQRNGLLELQYGLDGVYELNRHLSVDKGNVRGEAGVVWYP